MPARREEDDLEVGRSSFSAFVDCGEKWADVGQTRSGSYTLPLFSSGQCCVLVVGVEWTEGQVIIDSGGRLSLLLFVWDLFFVVLGWSLGLYTG